MRRAVVVLLLMSGGFASAAMADIYAPDPWRLGPPTRLDVERRWWLEIGPVFPDESGQTHLWQTGFDLAGGIEFPVTRSDGLGLRVRSGILPLRGTLSGDTLSGESWTLYSLTVAGQHRIALWRNSPSVRVLTGIEMGGASMRFGKVNHRASSFVRTDPARIQNGTIFGLGAGLEVAPEHAIGGFAKLGFDWFWGEGSYTWRSIAAGVTFPIQPHR